MIRSAESYIALTVYGICSNMELRNTELNFAHYCSS
jgi:hypothetical protein